MNIYICEMLRLIAKMNFYRDIENFGFEKASKKLAYILNSMRHGKFLLSQMGLENAEVEAVKRFLIDDEEIMLARTELKKAQAEFDKACANKVKQMGALRDSEEEKKTDRNSNIEKKSHQKRWRLSRNRILKKRNR